MKRKDRAPLRDTDDAHADIGPYKRVLPIAVGGMAEVFRALRPQAAGAERAVVIKRLRPELRTEAEHRARFEDEARLSLRIRHQNVVEVLDHDAQAEAPYLVLEYVFGVDLWRLARWIPHSGRPLDRSVALYVVTEMLAGLSAVHTARDPAGTALKIVHRDVSPSNVFLSVHGQVKLGDLGIARAALDESRRGSGTTPSSRPDLAKGKLGYLAPEQIDGKPFDLRADVFAAGTIAAELLLGAPLFAGVSELGILLAIRDADIGPLEAIRETLPAGLFDVLASALARDPERRTPDAETLRAALLPFILRPTKELAHELGGLVVGALDADGPQRPDRTSLALTVEASLEPGAVAAATKSLPPPRDARAAALSERARLFDLESAKSKGPRYEVSPAGGPVRLFDYAGLVRALRTADVDPESGVSVDSGPLRAIATVPELARHLSASSRTPRTASLEPMLDAGQAHDLSPDGILPVLAATLKERATGLLLCEREGARKEIHLDRGVPTFVTSNRAEELLGEQLLAAGVIDRIELDLALGAMPRFEGRLGDTLVALGLVDPVALFRHIAAQVRERLVEVFTWREGRAVFHPDATAPARSFPLGLDPFELFEAGVARRTAAGLSSPLSKEQRALVTDPRYAGTIALPPHARQLLELAQIPRSAVELEVVHADRARARAAMAVLLALGALRPQA